MKKLAALVLGLTLFAGIVLPAVIVPDVYDKLFLRCNGTGTTFSDSSTASPKTITANGNATQLPIKFNKSAGFFNGTSDYVVVPDSADWDFGTGDYNCEAFVNFSKIQDMFIFDTNTSGFSLYYTTGALKLAQVQTLRISYTWTPTLNTWYHIRVRRVSGTTTMYLDGNVVGTPYAGSDNIQAGTTGFAIGTYIASPQQMFPGWMKEIRIIKGASTTVTVPTTQYTQASEANTVLLMHFDTPATSPLAPAIAFDGTGDYLSLASSTDFNFGNGNFTLEAWIYPTAISGYNTFISRNGATDFMFYTHDGTLALQINGDLGAETGGVVLAVNKWQHVAAVRSGLGADQVKLYLNGREVASGSRNYNITSSSVLNIGQSTAGTYLFTGSMREIRISDSARYLNPFTPSQSGFTVDANTKLYIKGNENNGVTTFVDSETSPKTVTTAGDTKIKYTEDYRSCIFKDETGKFPYPVGSAKVDFFAIGSGVGYFDGTNSYLSVPDSEDWNFGTGDVTIEQYIRLKTITGYITPYDQPINGNNFVRCRINDGTSSDGKLRFYAYSGGSPVGAIITNGASGILANTWYHLAYVRSGASGYIMLNGTVLPTTVSTAFGTFPDLASQINIGYNSTDNNYTNGLIDNIRISKGVARYTASFNPPNDASDSTSTINGQMLSVF